MLTARLADCGPAAIEAVDQLPPELFLDPVLLLSSSLAHGWAIFRGDQRYDVETLFDAAMQVTETQWHPTRQVDWPRRSTSSVSWIALDRMGALLNSARISNQALR